MGSDEEAEDRKKQNNVRQKIRRLAQKEQQALDNNANNQKQYHHYHQKQDISLMVKEEVAKIEAKIDQFVAMFEQRIELKFKELTDRIDEKITSTLSTMANKSHEAERKRGQDNNK